MPQATVYFDLETGGLEHWRHPIIQIAAVVVNDQWQEIANFETKILVDEAKCDPKALLVNHYDRDIWSREAVMEQVALMQFSGLLEQYKCLNLVSNRTGRPYSVACLAGHNAAAFDLGFLTALYKRYNKFPPYDHRVRDTMHLALWYLDRRRIDLQSYKLTDLCRYFQIPVEESEAHDALYDVRLSIALARTICTRGESGEDEMRRSASLANAAFSGKVEMQNLP